MSLDDQARKRPVHVRDERDTATIGGEDHDTMLSPVMASPLQVPAMPDSASATDAATPTSTPATARPTKVARTEKAYKGLRHFSMMVCKKVEEKGTTSYNEVADELVSSIIEERKQDSSSAAAKIDEKNIRRRVYDALNVLMAMDIIAKDKKAITWKGLPTSAVQDLELLERELSYRRQEVERKREHLRELLVQQVCFRNLVVHNARREAELQQEKDAASSTSDQKIPLPFIIVNTHSNAVIECNMSKDKTHVKFDFSMPFEINDDNAILKRLGMHRAPRSVIRDMLSVELLQYCDRHHLLDTIVVAGGATDHHHHHPHLNVTPADYTTTAAVARMS